MRISGFIPTNTELAIDEILDHCGDYRVETSQDQDENVTTTTLSVENQNLKIHLRILSNGVHYESLVPELSAYLFIGIVAVIVLYSVIPAGIWSLLLLFVPALLIGTRVYYDRRIFQFVDSLIPQKYKIVPEMTTAEHIRWMTDDNVCPACGTQRNKYSEQCPGCGLWLDKPRSRANNLSHTGQGKIKIHYNHET